MFKDSTIPLAIVFFSSKMRLILPFCLATVITATTYRRYDQWTRRLQVNEEGIPIRVGVEQGGLFAPDPQDIATRIYSKHQRNALCRLAEHDHLDECRIYKYLVDQHGAELDMKAGLMAFARHGRFEFIKAWLKHTYDANDEGDRVLVKEMLIMAAEHGHLDVVNELLLTDEVWKSQMLRRRRLGKVDRRCVPIRRVSQPDFSKATISGESGESSGSHNGGTAAADNDRSPPRPERQPITTPPHSPDISANHNGKRPMRPSLYSTASSSSTHKEKDNEPCEPPKTLANADHSEALKKATLFERHDVMALLLDGTHHENNDLLQCITQAVHNWDYIGVQLLKKWGAPYGTNQIREMIRKDRLWRIAEILELDIAFDSDVVNNNNNPHRPGSSGGSGAAAASSSRSQ